MTARLVVVVDAIVLLAPIVAVPFAIAALLPLLLGGACAAPPPAADPRAAFAAAHGRVFGVVRVDRGDAAAAGWLVAGGEPQQTGCVALFDADAAPIASREVADDVVYAVAVAPGGALAAAALADGRVLRLALPGLEPEPLWQHGKPAVAVAFAPDGRTLASGGLDGVVRVGAVHAANPAPVVLEHGAPVTCVAWSHEGERVLAGTRDGKVRLHERSGRLVRSWLRLHGAVTAVGWRGAAPWARVRASPLAAERELALELP